MKKKLLMLATAALACAGCNERKDDLKPGMVAEGGQPVLTAQAVLDVLDGESTAPQLTISPSLQRQVTSILEQHVNEDSVEQGWAVVLSAKDGAVLAMADCGVDDASLRPLAVKKTFEPGYVVSPVTLALAFADEKVTPDTMISTGAEPEKYVELPRDAHAFAVPEISVKEALARSSNVILAKIGQDLGDRVFSGFSIWGLDRKGAVDLGIFNVAFDGGGDLGGMSGSRRLTSRVAIGQGFKVNALQLARAYAILANKGRRIEPHLVRHGSGKDAFEQVISRDAAEMVCGILEIDGNSTGKRAAVPGVRVAGKTGTANCKDAESGRYVVDRFAASFAGFFPLDNPAYVIVVCYETKKIQGERADIFGGIHPASTFAEIVKFIESLNDSVVSGETANVCEDLK